MTTKDIGKITVEAENLEEAKEKALQFAGDFKAEDTETELGELVESN